MSSGHLTSHEIEQLSRETDPRSGDGWSHVENCPQCKTLLAKYQAVGAKLDKLASMRIAPKPGTNCPDERIWFDVSTGTLPHEESLQHIQHAAECDWCGQKLKAATRLFEEELSLEEEKILAALPSSDAKQQQKFAERLSQAAVRDSHKYLDAARKGSRPYLWKMLSSAFASATVTGVLLFVFVIRPNSPSYVEKLLATAYSEDRTIDPRIPYARHAESSETRSGSNRSVSAKPKAFLEAASKISSKLKDHPDDSRWLVLQAQLDLLGRNYQSALAALDHIQSDAENPNILLMRALALYEQGQQEHQRGPFGEAINLLGKILQKDPENTVALFNQALACEQTQSYECAMEDWDHLLRIESDKGWAAEALEHRTHIQEKKTLSH